MYSLYMQAFLYPLRKHFRRIFFMLKKNAIESIEKTIGYEFECKQLLSQAFTRSSYHYEHPEDQSNEILEFEVVIYGCKTPCEFDEFNAFPVLCWKRLSTRIHRQPSGISNGISSEISFAESLTFS